MILCDLLLKSLIDHPKSTIGNIKELITYEKLHELVDIKRGELAIILNTRPIKGARVAIVRKNSTSYISDLLAVLSARAVPFLIDPVLGQAEIATLHEHCGFDAILYDSSVHLPPGGQVTDCAGTNVWVPTRRDLTRPELHPDTEICRLTSGSTRSPACIEFSGAAVSAAAQAWCSASELKDTDRILCFAGLYNGLAFNTSLVPGLLAGASLFIPSGLPSSSNMRRHLESLAPTVFVAFPAAYDLLATANIGTAALNSLRLALSSAATLSERTSAILSDQSIHVSDYYGIAETGPLTFNPNPTPGGGQGYALPGVSLRTEPTVGAVGSLFAKSQSMGTRYLNYPGELESRITADGYYQTSDRGRITNSGVLFLSGRVGRSFNIGGRKFSSEEVEDMLKSHPAVGSAVVALVEIGSKRPLLGAVIERTAKLDAVELRRHCLMRSAPFKVPERIVFVDALPRNGAGKIQVAKIEALLLDHNQDDIAETKE